MVSEHKMLSLIEKERPNIPSLISVEQLLVWQKEVEQVHIAEEVKQYIIQLVHATRNSAMLQW